MAVPEQVRKQAEAVQEIYKQINAGDNQGAENSDANDSAQPVAQGVESSVADENPATDNAAPAPASEHKPGADNVPEETVVQKYRTLQGMYNAEVPRLHQQNRELNQRIQQMEQLFASLSAQQNSAAAPLPTEAKLINEQDVADYGDSIEVMRKVSREELAVVAQRIAQLEQTIQQLNTQVVPQVQTIAQRQQVSAEQQFWADLAMSVPNFRDINSNEQFQSWLLEADPLTGITRQTYLEDAQRNLDARRVSNFFRAWLESTGQASVAQPTGRATGSELEKQVAPGRTRNAGAPQSSKAKTYSPQDIQKFFNDVRMGKYKGREQERDRIERDIFAAQRENRIIINA